MNHNPLRKLDEVEVDASLRKRTLSNIYSKKKRMHRSMRVAIALCASVLLVVTLFNVFQQPAYGREYSYITIDMNPSLELVLNRKNDVIEIITYNEEAKKLIKNLSYKEKNYEEVLAQLLQSDACKQYMNADTFVQISVYSKNKNRGIEIEDRVYRCMQNQSEVSFQSACVDTRLKEEAKTHHVSSGRYMLIEQIRKLDITQSFDELITYDMQRLQSLYEKLGGNESICTRHCRKRGNH